MIMGSFRAMVKRLDGFYDHGEPHAYVDERTADIFEYDPGVRGMKKGRTGPYIDLVTFACIQNGQIMGDDILEKLRKELPAHMQ